jgi:ubiquinone/menaquinone biosynthesis C-methylase UbiE
MKSGYDPSLFAGTAEYYAHYRPKYPRELFDFIREGFQLNKNSRVLDLGCGTGNASIPLAPVVGEVIAMDPDSEMIRVGRELADAARVRNVKWLQAGSEDLSPSLGPVRLVVMGQSFHWMDRDQVLRDLYDIVEDGGGIALIGPAHGLVLIGPGPEQPPRDSWQPIAEGVIRKFVGERGRHPRSNPAEPRHEAALMRSRFAIAEYHEFASEMEFDIDSILGRLYSKSGNLRALLGDRVDEFEAELRAALLRVRPDGRFVEHPRTAVLAALKR